MPSAPDRNEEASAPAPANRGAVTPLEAATIKKDVEATRIFSGRIFPFAVIPLGYAKIIVTRKTPTAAVDRKGNLYVNPDFWLGLNATSRRTVLIHEAMHLCLCHPQRAKGYNPRLFNIAADAKINESLPEGWFEKLPQHVNYNSLLNALDVSRQELEQASTEEIAKMLEKASPSVSVALHPDLVDTLETDPSDAVVQEGEPPLEDDPEKAWRNMCQRAHVLSKMAGSSPASLEREILEVVERRPPWRVVVRNVISSGMPADMSFCAPSRRSDDLPGTLRNQHRGWFLIDTSGSIDERTLASFLGFVKHCARNAALKVVAWDAAAYEPINARTPSDVAHKVAPKMKGGGGTTISPALEKALAKIAPGDGVVILTDGHISDLDQETAQSLFASLAKKAAYAIYAYTERSAAPPGFVPVRVEV